MIWPEKLYQFTKVQGAITTYTFKCVQDLPSNEPLTAKYISNYKQGYYITESELSSYHTSLESCYEAWIESIEKFKQKVIKQFENKCGIEYSVIEVEKLLKEISDEMD